MIELNDINNSSGMYIVAKDKYLKFIYCNEPFAQALGLDSPQQIIGKNDFDFFDKNSSVTYQMGDIKVMRGEPFINILEKQKRMNQTFQNLVTKAPIKNNEEEKNGVVITFLTSHDFSNTFHAGVLNLNPNSGKYEFYIDKQKAFFSKKEYAVFKLILIGNTTKQIAVKLKLSSRTIECYINSIKYKLQSPSKSSITETAIRLGIINQGMLEVG